MYLQYALWVTRGGIHDVDKLKVSVAEQNDEIARLKERNRALAAEVTDLKQGMEAVEERSRSEMGMIKRGEVFFRITDPNHEHDIPQHGAAVTGQGVEPPLEPPLDPVAPGSAAISDDQDSPAAPQDQPMSVKPQVQAATPTAKSRLAPLAQPARLTGPAPTLRKAAPVE